MSWSGGHLETSRTTALTARVGAAGDRTGCCRSATRTALRARTRMTTTSKSGPQCWPALSARRRWVFGDGRGGQRAGAMTSGILVGLMATGAILLAAIVGAIWLEGRMPGQPEQRLRPSSPGHQPRPVTVPAGRQWAILPDQPGRVSEPTAGTTGEPTSSHSARPTPVMRARLMPLTAR